MRKTDLIALKKCGPHKPGAAFSATSVEARALIALKRARKQNQSDSLPIYAADSDLFTVQPSQDLHITQKSDDDDLTQAGADGLLVSQPVREFALENNIDIATVTGTGKDGRINKKDIELSIAAKSDVDDK